MGRFLEIGAILLPISHHFPRSDLQRLCATASRGSDTQEEHRESGQRGDRCCGLSAPPSVTAVTRPGTRGQGDRPLRHSDVTVTAIQLWSMRSLGRRDGVTPQSPGRPLFRSTDKTRRALGSASRCSGLPGPVLCRRRCLPGPPGTVLEVSECLRCPRRRRRVRRGTESQRRLESTAFSARVRS